VAEASSNKNLASEQTRLKIYGRCNHFGVLAPSAASE